MNTTSKLGTFIAAAALATGSISAYASCEMDAPIQIANMSWASASAIAHIESIILVEGYGCKTELIPGDTVPTATTMLNKGRPHIAPEVWSSNIAEILAEGEAKNAISVAGDVFSEGGIDAWWIPKYLSDEYPDIKTVADMARYSHLFEDADNPDKGRFYNSLPGWSNETMSTNLMRGYGLDEHYNLYSAGSSAALDASIASNYKRKKPVFFYYWAPSAIMGQHEMVRLEMNDFDAQRDACNYEEACENPTAGGYPKVKVITLVAGEVQTSAPLIYEFLGKVQFETATVNKLLAWGAENKAESEEVAEYFLKNYQDVWTTWVPADVADKVIASQAN
uniref:glycine betaine ABC transporter substrate-binding protein n=1 Tax=Marinobacterium profundum TaxID=1714300 RepID=UPI00082BF428|nr:glycine betaine ABC transporter substrate-binding protein [Marinobacterium profundum]